VREIIRQLRVTRSVGLEKTSNERFIFRMHTTLYHRPAKDYDKDVEYCKVFSMIADPITWEEVMRIAITGEQV